MMKIIKVSALPKYMLNFSIPLLSFDLSDMFETFFLLKSQIFSIHVHPVVKKVQMFVKTCNLIPLWKKCYLCAFIHGKTNNAKIVLFFTTTINCKEKLVTIIHLWCLHFFPDSMVFLVKKAPKRRCTTTQSVLSFHMCYKVKMLVCLHMALQEQVGAKCVIDQKRFLKT